MNSDYKNKNKHNNFNNNFSFDIEYSKYKKNRKLIDINKIDLNENFYLNNEKCSIAIIIPHRNRLEHLEMFIKHFSKLDTRGNAVDIYLIDQNNADLFNRGLLLNIGFVISSSMKKYDKYIFHDVDSYPEQYLFDLYFDHHDKIIHYASPDLGYKYTNYSFFGGIVGMNHDDYKKINGFPNSFFGHGGEDDAMLNRIIATGLKNVYRPTKGKYILVDHDRPTELEYNKTKKKNILQDLKSWQSDGLQQLKKIFINIKKYKNYNDFINNYLTENTNILNNASQFDDFINKLLKTNNENMSVNTNTQSDSESIYSSTSSDDPVYLNTNISYYFYKIDYLVKHRMDSHFFVNSDFIKNEIELKNQKLLNSELKNITPIYNKLNNSFVSVIYPIISWEEIEEKIINTFTPPKIYTNKINKESKLKKIIKNSFESYEKKLTKEDLFSTIKHVFNNYNELLYFRIRDKKIVCEYQLYNPKNSKDWYKDLKYVVNDKIKSVDEAFVEIAQKSNREYFTLRKPHFMASNNCLLSGVDEYAYWEGNPVSYVKSFKEMIEFVVLNFDVPDCDILINRKDFPYLRKDKKYAYDHLTDDQIEENISFYPVGSQSVAEENMDIPIISADEWEFSKNKKPDLEDLIKNWDNKKSIALFRGSGTGCSVTDSNPRIKLAEISKKWENDQNNSKLIDVKLSKLVGRIKAYKKFIGITDYKKYKHLVGSFMTTEEQMLYKYVFNIEGNSQAYRFSSQFYKGLVINVKSKYNMWFYTLLEKNKHFIEIDSSYENLDKEIKKLQSNDDNAKNIFINGINWANIYTDKNTLAEYMFYYMYYLNKILT